MKIKSGFKLNTVCGETFLVPMGEGNVDYSKLIALNESSLLLWKRMEQGDFSTDDLVKALLEEYEVTEEVARKDVEIIIRQFKEENIITE
jgi:hypothetical protein